MKTCRSCGLNLDDSLFNTRKGSKDGLQSYCRKCHSKKNCDNQRRKWGDRDEGFLQKRRLYSKRWKKDNREKHRAHWIVEYAVKSGKLARGSCEACGSSTDIHAHHDDYSKPLEVRWLCPLHHRHERK